MTIGKAVRAIQSSLMLSSIRCSLSVTSLQRTRRLGRTLANVLGRQWTTEAEIVAALNNTPARIPGSRHCLSRAIATESLLQRIGSQSQLHIGVQIQPTGHDKRLEAHAWLTSGTRVIVGDNGELERYHILPSIDDPWETIAGVLLSPDCAASADANQHAFLRCLNHRGPFLAVDRHHRNWLAARWYRREASFYSDMTLMCTADARLDNPGNP